MSIVYISTVFLEEFSLYLHSKYISGHHDDLFGILFLFPMHFDIESKILIYTLWNMEKANYYISNLGEIA